MIIGQNTQAQYALIKNTQLSILIIFLPTYTKNHLGSSKNQASISKRPFNIKISILTHSMYLKLQAQFAHANQKFRFGFRSMIASCDKIMHFFYSKIETKQKLQFFIFNLIEIAVPICSCGIEILIRVQKHDNKL